MRPIETLIQAIEDHQNSEDSQGHGYNVIDDNARSLHRHGYATIVDMGSYWSVCRHGKRIGTIAWEGHKGTPSFPNATEKAVYFANVKQLQEAGVEFDEEFNEASLRDPMTRSPYPLPELAGMLTVEGKEVMLPVNMRFTPVEYASVKQAMVNAGATYTRKGFVFDTELETQAAMEALLANKPLNIKQQFQFYPTTDKAGDVLLEDLDCTGKIVLEPNGGDGYLVKRAFLLGAESVLTAEINPKMHSLLKQAGATLIAEDIFDLTAEDVKDVDIVLMNPPFANCQDVEHLNHILSIVPDKTEIRAIMSASVLTNPDKRYTHFRERLKEEGLEPIKLDKGAFKESGTQVDTVALIIPSELKPRPDMAISDVLFNADHPLNAPQPRKKVDLRP